MLSRFVFVSSGTSLPLGERQGTEKGLVVGEDEPLARAVAREEHQRQDCLSLAPAILAVPRLAHAIHGEGQSATTWQG